ncbi:hypothetical protein EX30DRAFT_24326 [Ascodesmis nigricans]|uniref:Cyclin n=1 Tax=Ascodesmis nigricans TaxID=341454 RepID=A0A4S2N899_9PEZI|nr:hypothetical protein EX30DRAFT_24326 [Ascodesmis nigricans]
MNESQSSAESSSLPPVPALQRQGDRKFNFVENLVDSAAHIVETIWTPPKYITCNNPQDAVLPLRVFIQETLRRSRTSYSTLQVALYYLIVIKPHLPGMDSDVSGLEPEQVQLIRAKQCGRRMFLAALILASKYLQDRNYSARAWSKISGLNTHEINVNEKAFLEAIDWRLHISELVFQKWTDLVLKYTSAPSAPSVSLMRGTPWNDEEQRRKEFCELIASLSPDLREVNFPTPEPARVDTNNTSPAHIDIAPAPPKPARISTPAPLRKTFSMPSQLPQILSQAVQLHPQQPNGFTGHDQYPRPMPIPVSTSNTSVAYITPAASTDGLEGTPNAMSTITLITKKLNSCSQELHPRALSSRRTITDLRATTSISRNNLLHCMYSNSPATPPSSALPSRQHSFARSSASDSPTIEGPQMPMASYPSPSIKPASILASPKSQEAAWTLNLLRESTSSPNTTSGYPTPQAITRKRSYPSISGSTGSSGVTPRLRGLSGFGSPNIGAGRSPNLDRGGKRMRCGWELDRFEGVGQQVAQGAR